MNLKTNKMKNLRTQLALLAIASFAFSITSCTDGVFGIRGDGPIVSQTLELEDLKGVDMNISGNVHLTQSENQEIIIEAQQNIIDNLETNVHNGIVDFDFDRNVKKHDGVDIYMSIHTLSHLSLSGSGDINTTAPFSTNEILTLNLSGSGDFNIEADALEIYSNISGSGDFYIATETEYLQCGISGSGSYTLVGSATEADYSVSGSGNFSAFELDTDKTSIRVSGSGDARVSANNELDIKISGSGNVWYKGHPDVNSDISGSGDVSNAN